MNLAESAMLVSVTIINGGLLGERRDKRAKAYVERKFKLHEKRAKASKYLIDRTHPKVKAVVTASQRVRNVFHKYTMPWGDDKSRLLAVDVREIFEKKLAEAEQELKDTWDEYAQVYPALVSASERELGELFDRADYPSAGRARDLFVFKRTYWPIPQTSNFVAKLASEAAVKAKADMSLEIEARLKDSAQTLVARGKETVATMVERLEAYASKDGAKIMQAIVDNCRETADLIDYMNLTKNNEISMMATNIRRLGYATAEEYRNDPTKRSNSILRGKAILARVLDLKTLDHELAEMVADAAEYQF